MAPSSSPSGKGGLVTAGRPSQSRQSKTKLKQTSLSHDDSSKVINLVDSEDDAKTEVVGTDALKLASDRERMPISQAEKAWLTPRYQDFLKLPHNDHRHTKVVAFKKKLADDFVKEFKFTDKVEKHRQV